MRAIIESSNAKSPETSFWVAGSPTEIQEIKTSLGHLFLAAAGTVPEASRTDLRELIARFRVANYVSRAHKRLFVELVTMDRDVMNPLLSTRAESLVRPAGGNQLSSADLSQQIEEIDNVEAVLGATEFLTPEGIAGHLTPAGVIEPLYYTVAQYGAPKELELPPGTTNAGSGFRVTWPDAPLDPPQFDPTEYGVYGRMAGEEFVIMYDERQIRPIT